ncbi:MAG: hypothetical protein IH985_00420 [Planctomycetes bacterium]|nr:hypothetical protein [Planctomycetota bacterium]
MNWKRIWIITSVGANVVTLILLGVWFIWVHFSTFPYAAGPFDASLQRDFGLLALGFGVLNIVCVRYAVVWRGQRQQNHAIYLGYMSSGFTAFIGYLFTTTPEGGLPFFALGSTALITAWTLRYARHTPRQKGLCPHCDYNLAGLPSGVCPECGKGEGEATERRRGG